MIKALLLIFDPIATWDRIALSKRSVAFIFLVHVLPLVLLGSAVEGYGLMKWGEWQKQLGNIKYFSQREAILFESMQTVLLVFVVFVCARTIRSMGDTFHSRHSFTQAFTVVAYGLGPFFLFRMLDAAKLSPWIAWAAGILLTISVLYHGVPKVMEPDPSHAFGLYVTSWMLLLFTTGILRYATAAYLNGTIKLPILQGAG